MEENGGSENEKGSFRLIDEYQIDQYAIDLIETSKYLGEILKENTSAKSIRFQERIKDGVEKYCCDRKAVTDQTDPNYRPIYIKFGEDIFDFWFAVKSLTFTKRVEFYYFLNLYRQYFESPNLYQLYLINTTLLQYRILGNYMRFPSHEDSLWIFGNSLFYPDASYLFDNKTLQGMKAVTHRVDSWTFGRLNVPVHFDQIFDYFKVFTEPYVLDENTNKERHLPPLISEADMKRWICSWFTCCQRPDELFEIPENILSKRAWKYIFDLFHKKYLQESAVEKKDVMKLMTLSIKDFETQRSDEEVNKICDKGILIPTQWPTHVNRHYDKMLRGVNL